MTSTGKQRNLFPDGCRDAEPGFSALASADPVRGMTNAALLASLIGRRAEERCRQLALHGDLRAVAKVHLRELANLGFTTAEMARLEAIFEVARRFGETPWTVGAPFRGSYDVYAHFRERLATETREVFIAILLDNKNRKLREVLVSLGSLTSSLVHPREVYAPVIRDSAAAVLFCHNHPSGDPTPSKEDLEITRRLREVGEIVGVRVLDHVVIGHGRYVSFVDDGYW